MTTPRPYWADMTELIAGDSHIQPTELNREDPRALEIFEALVSTLCSKSAVLHFEQPRYLPEFPGLLVDLWQEVHSKQLQRGIALPPKVARPDDEERWNAMSPAFDDALDAQGGLLGDLVSFTEFQMSSSRMMDIFWGPEHNPNNTVDRLRESLKRISPSALARLRAALAASRIQLDSTTHQILDGAKMTSADAAVAYPFWAFVKGYRSPVTMRDNHIHLIHWLREGAVPAGTEVQATRDIDSDQLRRLFPWGPAIGVLLKQKVISRNDTKRLRALITDIRSTDEPLAGRTDLDGDIETRTKRMAEAINDVRNSAADTLSKLLSQGEQSKLDIGSLIAALAFIVNVCSSPSDITELGGALLAGAKYLAPRLLVTICKFAMPPKWFEGLTIPVVRDVQMWKARRAIQEKLIDKEFLAAAKEYVHAINKGRVLG